MNKWLVRFFAAFFLLIALVVMLGSAVLKWMARDQPDWPDPHPDVDLTPDLPVLTELRGSNGVFHLVAMDTRLENRSPELKTVVKDWDEGLGFGEAVPAMDEYLVADPEILAEFQRASNCSFWQAKTLLTIDEVVPATLLSMNLARLNAYRMEQAAAQDEWELLRDIATRQLRINQGSAQGGNILHHLVYLACDRITFDQLTVILSQCDPPPVLLDALEAEIRDRKPKLPRVTGCMETEWFSMKDAVERALQGEALTGDRFPVPLMRILGSNSATTPKNMAALWSHLVHDMTLPYGREGMVETWLESMKEGGPLNIVGASDPMGRLLVQVLLPAGSRVRDDDYENRLRQDAMVVQLVLERHQQKTGTYPDRLETLVPDKLAAIPVDLTAPIRGPLRYERRGADYVLYGLGRNQVDDGGVVKAAENRRSKSYDAVFHPNERLKAMPGKRSEEEPRLIPK